MRDVTPILRSLGLLESEIKVYLGALELGPSTVLDLAKETRLSRPATYAAIDSLAGRGLMSTVQAGKKRLFAAEHPDRLLHYAQAREAELRGHVADLSRAIPELALRIGGERPVVKAFEGKEGITAIIQDYQRTRPKAIDEIADIDAMRLVLTGEDLAPMREELTRIGTKIRGLYAGASVRPTSITSARILPEHLRGFRGNISIYGQKVALVTFTGKFHSVIVEDATIAATMRTLFEVAWAGAGEFPNPKSDGA